MKLSKRLAAVMVAAAPVALLAMPIGSAGASTASPARTFAFAAVAAPAVGPPNSTIQGTPAKYMPATLRSLEAGWDGVLAHCFAQRSFQITNEETVPEQVTLGGAPFGRPIAPEGVLGVCAKEAVSGATATFGLARNTAAALKVTFLT